MEIINNDQLQLAHSFVQYTDKNIFLTGKAGTGKTTFLQTLKERSNKRMIVVAPTGVAAINAGGVTIHSFFQMPFGPYIPGQEAVIQNGDSPRNVPAHIKKFSRDKINIIKSLDLIVIDEVSMVRADLLDGVDEVLRRYKNRYKPFGGVQLLMIGDLQQLAPIVKDDEWELLKPYYDTMFFFSSRALQKTTYISVELIQIFRQSDTKFIELLNKIRENKADRETLEILNKRYKKDFNPGNDEGYITLTTHNMQAQGINESKLKAIPGREMVFLAEVNGDFPDYMYPTEEELKLKVGAQVMFVKNDPSREKLFYNGKIGVIVGFGEDVIFVKCPDMNENIMVEPLTWQNMKYSINEETKEIQETEIGAFAQYPLKLAWAITIHKSQGLTFERAIINARDAFAHGQVYVALSRCKTLEGMVLSTPISSHAIISNSVVYNFTRNIEENQPDEKLLDQSIIEYQRTLLDELFNFSLIKWNIQHVIQTIKEHAESIIGNCIDTFVSMNSSAHTNIIEIANKFINQRRQLIQGQENIEENQPLQERIKKACSFFVEKLDDLILEAMDESSFETDNKEARKNLKNALQKLRETVLIKRACLETSKQGFNVKDYLETRAKSSIEDSPHRKKEKKEKKTEVKATDEILHPLLFNKLKEWRMKKSIEGGVPAYMILHQKALLGIVNFLPPSISKLKRIKGIGKKTAIKYGDEITTIITSYCDEKNIVMPEVNEESEDTVKPAKKKDTKQASRELLEAGNTIEEIAAERGISVRTVQQHLAHFVGTGDLSLQQFVPADKAAMIIDFYRNNDTTLMNPVKEALGDRVEYSDIMFVLKYLKFEGQL